MKILLLILVLLAGCATQGGYQGMTAEQLAALAKMKDANVQCIKGVTPITGQFLTILVSVDKGVIPEGGITVSPDCAVSVTNTRVTTTTTTVVSPIAKPAQ